MNIDQCRQYFVLLLIVFSSSTNAEWLANAGLGLSYKDNYSLQNGNYDNIAQAQTTRTGTELSAAFSWQSLTNVGGYSIDAVAMNDKATDRNSNIRNLKLSVSRLQAINSQWMARFTGALTRYSNDDFIANNFNAISLTSTAGYFGSNRQGLDLNLNWIAEDHNSDPQSLYKIQRLGAGAIYYFAHQSGFLRNSASLAIQKHDSNDNRRDAFSLLASFDVDQIWWGKNLFRLTLSWRQDQYDQAYTPSTDISMPFSPIGSGSGFGSGMGQGGGMSGPPGNPSDGINTTEPRKDNQLYLSASYQRQISRQFRIFVSANGGKYMSISTPGKQTFYNLFTGVRWYTN